jgi:hypothetical protein
LPLSTFSRMTTSATVTLPLPLRSPHWSGPIPPHSARGWDAHRHELQEEHRVARTERSVAAHVTADRGVRRGAAAPTTASVASPTRIPFHQCLMVFSFMIELEFVITAPP